MLLLICLPILHGIEFLCWRTHISYIMFVIRYYVFLLIPILFSEENPPNDFNHAVMVSGYFICQSVENHLTECVQYEYIRVFFSVSYLKNHCLGDSPKGNIRGERKTVHVVFINRSRSQRPNHSPRLWDIVNCGGRRVVVPARQPKYNQAGRYGNPMRELTLSPQSETINSATAVTAPLSPPPYFLAVPWYFIKRRLNRYSLLDIFFVGVGHLWWTKFERNLPWRNRIYKTSLMSP
jgi:hypothetical protein